MIDVNPIFEEKQINDNRLYPITRLHDIMLELGMTRMKRSSFTTDFINRKINTGELIMPPKAAFDRWKLSGKQMKEIVLAFMPGGDGFWSYLGETKPLNEDVQRSGRTDEVKHDVREELPSETQDIHESPGQRHDGDSSQAIQGQ